METADRRRLRIAAEAITVLTTTLSMIALTVSGPGDTGAVAATTSGAADPPTPAVSASSDARWPSSVAGRKILDQHGNVYLLKTFSSWGMAQRLTDSEITEALEGIAARGFNAVTVAPNGIGVQADWVKYENVAGDPFFATTAGGRNSTRPFTGELGAAWSSMDRVIEEAARLGITVLVSFFVSYGTSGITPDLTAATNRDAESYGIALATRYLDARNIVWHVMGDTGWSAGDTIGRRLDYLFKGIIETETAPRLIVAEPYLGGNGSEMFIDQEGTDPTGYEWLHLSTNALYSYEDNSVEVFDDVWDQAGAATYPVWDSEPPYAAAIDKYGGDFRQQLRERNYAVFIRGGCGINYGDEDWWRFGNLGFYDGGLEWFEVPDAAPTIDAQYAWTVLDQYVADPKWHPDRGTFVTTGVGSGDTKAASGFSDTAALAYFPSSRTIVVDTTILSGTTNVRLRWYDPTDGTFDVIATSEAQTATRSVTHPGTNTAGVGDWVLVVDPAGGSVAPPTTTVPTAPRSLTATPGNRSARLTWLPPSSIIAGAPISDYIVQRSADGGRTWKTINDGISTARTVTIGGLTNGHRYRFHVAAVNNAGRGAWSSAASVVPATVPSSPRRPSATSAYRAAKLTWLAPWSNGGAPITDYVVQRSADGGRTWRTVRDGVSIRRAATVKRLTSGKRYSFRVAAANRAGRGAWSAVVRIAPK